jgi:hypothetical protein
VAVKVPNPNPSHKKNTLAGLSVPTSIGDPNLSRFLQSLKQHVELIHGNLGQPRERFVTLDDLQRAGLVDIAVKGGRGEIINAAATQNAKKKSARTIVNNIDGSDFPWDGRSGQQGNVLRLNGSTQIFEVTRLFDASDIVLREALPPDILYEDSSFNFIGVPSFLGGLNIANDKPISWYGTDSILREMLKLDNTSGDFYYDNAKVIATFNGTDGDTAYSEQSADTRAATFVGNAELDDAQFKFGATSLLLDGAGDYISFADSADYDIAAGDFTIEGHVRYNSTTPAVTGNAMVLAAHWTETGNQRGWYVAVNDENRLEFNWSVDGAAVQTVVTNSDIGIVANTWYHLAITRSGDTLLFHVNGVEFTTSGDDITGDSIFDSTASFRVGSINAASPLYHDGWIDDVRFTVGQARYTSDFSELLESYPINDGTNKFLIGNAEVYSYVESPLLHTKDIRPDPDSGNYAYNLGAEDEQYDQLWSRTLRSVYVAGLGSTTVDIADGSNIAGCSVIAADVGSTATLQIQPIGGTSSAMCNATTVQAGASGTTAEVILDGIGGVNSGSSLAHLGGPSITASIRVAGRGNNNTGAVIPLSTVDGYIIMLGDGCTNSGTVNSDGGTIQLLGVACSNHAGVDGGSISLEGLQNHNFGATTGAGSSISATGDYILNTGPSSSAGTIDLQGDNVTNFGAVSDSGSVMTVTGSQVIVGASVAGGAALNVDGDSNKIFSSISGYDLTVDGADNLVAGALSGTGAALIDATSTENVCILGATSSGNITVTGTARSFMKLTASSSSSITVDATSNAYINHLLQAPASSASYAAPTTNSSTFFSNVYQLQPLSSFVGGGVANLNNIIMFGGTGSSFECQGWGNVTVALLGLSHDLKVYPGSTVSTNLTVGSFNSPSGGATESAIRGYGNLTLAVFNSAIGYGDIDIAQVAHVGSAQPTCANLSVVAGGIDAALVFNKNILFTNSRASAAIAWLVEANLDMSADGSMFVGEVTVDSSVTGSSSFQLGTGILPWDGVFQIGVSGTGMAMKATAGAYAVQYDGQMWNDGANGVKIRSNAVDIILLQQAGTGENTGHAAVGGTNVDHQDTFTGNVGASAYTINDIVKALKNQNLLAQ